MLRLSALTLAGLIGLFIIFGGELSSTEKAELDALRAQRTSVVAMLSDAFATPPRRPTPYVATLAQLTPKRAQKSTDGLVQLASYTPTHGAARPKIAATTTVADPAKLAAHMNKLDMNVTSPDMVLRAVTAPRVNVRSGPSTSNPVLGQVMQADIVRVISNPNDPWVKILIEGDGIEGYMSSRFLTQAPE